jgi:hypothetical protein
VVLETDGCIPLTSSTTPADAGNEHWPNSAAAFLLAFFSAFRSALLSLVSLLLLNFLSPKIE